jgi:hypothetical protein
MMILCVVLVLIVAGCVRRIWNDYASSGQGRARCLWLSLYSFSADFVVTLVMVSRHYPWWIWASVAAAAGYTMGLIVTGPGAHARYVEDRRRVLQAVLTKEQLGADLGRALGQFVPYSLLASMEDDDLLQGQSLADGRRKYRITGHGRAWLMDHPGAPTAERQPQAEP